MSGYMSQVHIFYGSLATLLHSIIYLPPAGTKTLNSIKIISHINNQSKFVIKVEQIRYKFLWDF